MLRDIKDSERINREVQKQWSKEQGPDALGIDEMDVSKLYVKVVSTGFWEQFGEMQEEANPVEDQDGPAPAKLSQGFTPNRALMGSFEHFVDHYQKYKSLRTLIFRQNLGSVELTLSFENGDFPFSVTPIQAAVISLFSSASDESVQLTLDELHNNINNSTISSETNSSLSVSVDQLKQELTYWVCRGVLAHSGGRLYSTVNVYEPRKQAQESEGGEGLQVQQKSGPTSATRPQAAKPA